MDPTGRVFCEWLRCLAGLVSCSWHLESSLWCVADALVYEPHLLALLLVPGAVFTSWLLDGWRCWEHSALASV